MRIALYGYGRMGKAIEAAATARGYSIVLKVTAANAGSFPTGADAAIEFSRPDEAVKNIKLCLQNKVPVVVGTTGWYERMDEVRGLVEKYGGAVLWASNFSIGVNLFFRVNRQLAALMNKQTDYSVHIDEIHHVHKLDKPSGTAITLAKDIDLNHEGYCGWELLEDSMAPMSWYEPPIPIRIASERVGEVPGKHSVTWSSDNDRITITHEAFDRTGFAQGAVLAAEWLQGRTGLFTMDDMLG